MVRDEFEDAKFSNLVKIATYDSDSHFNIIVEPNPDPDTFPPPVGTHVSLSADAAKWLRDKLCAEYGLPDATVTR